MFPADITLPRAAELDQHVEGRISIVDLPRLAPLLSRENQSEACFRMDFSLDLEKRAVVKGQVQATVHLICQRCLQVYPCEITSEFSLVAVENLTDALHLDKRYEAVLLHDHQLRVAEVIEDELLLGLPLVPKHPSGECEGLPETQPADRESHNPFSSLEQFKKNRSN